MTVGCRANVSLPFVTKAADHTKYTKPLTCVDPYQTLPDPVLAVRNPMVVLDWSTNCYHPPDLALPLPCVTFTNNYHRGLGLTIELSI